jgi:hypothetical protein
LIVGPVGEGDGDGDGDGEGGIDGDDEGFCNGASSGMFCELVGAFELEDICSLDAAEPVEEVGLVAPLADGEGLGLGSDGESFEVAGLDISGEFA